MKGHKYIKPNIGALEGECGRKIFETIRDCPDTDWDKLAVKSKQIEKRILAARREQVIGCR